MDLNKKIIALSLLIFISSLFFDAFKVVDLGKIENYKSILVFLFGTISFLGGGFAEFFIWSANIWFFTSILFLFKKNFSISVVCSLVAVSISLSFSFWNNILISENGRKGIIHSLEIGYFLWIVAILSVLISAIYLKNKYRVKRI